MKKKEREMMSKRVEDDQIRQAVKEHYAGRVSSSCCEGNCGCGDSSAELDKIGAENYQGADLQGIPQEALQQSFGCGNPLAFAGVQEGQTVVDIGSGAGLDAMLAAKAVGNTGHVFGIDMTAEMIQRAEENVRQAGLQNITFLLGEAEDMPLADATADWVISNCVINLSPDKDSVFHEIFRILKPGGQMLVSDMVAENLPDGLKNDITAWAGCIAGAVSEKDYIAAVERAGFTQVRVVDSVEHSLHVKAEIIKEFLPGVTDSMLEDARKKETRVASIRLSAVKP
jgi:SAM-dependent methyltransferase